jgi:inorganic pyrophosphatase
MTKIVYMNLFHLIKQDKSPELLKLIVEIAKGDHLKYEFNKDYGVLELDRVLYGPNFFPVAYCDVPSTWNKHDKDPLDAVFYSTGIVKPGVMVYGKVIGVMLMVDNGEEDHKIICVNDKDYRYKHINDIDDLPEYEKKDLQTFFETYKIPQTGKDSVIVKGFKNKQEAYKIIQEAIVAYHEEFANKHHHDEDHECGCGGDCGCHHH